MKYILFFFWFIFSVIFACIQFVQLFLRLRPNVIFPRVHHNNRCSACATVLRFTVVASVWIISVKKKLFTWNITVAILSLNYFAVLRICSSLPFAFTKQAHIHVLTILFHFLVLCQIEWHPTREIWPKEKNSSDLYFFLFCTFSLSDRILVSPHDVRTHASINTWRINETDIHQFWLRSFDLIYTPFFDFVSFSHTFEWASSACLAMSVLYFASISIDWTILFCFLGFLFGI